MADVCHIFDSIKNEPGDREEMRHSIFEGSAAAIVTPMDDYGNLDYEAMGRLLDRIMDGGTDAVVVNGTTGESATLDDREKLSVMEYVIRHCRHGEQLHRACGKAFQGGGENGGGWAFAGNALL
mgnify:CR=1 FL=1